MWQNRSDRIGKFVPFLFLLQKHTDQAFRVTNLSCRWRSWNLAYCVVLIILSCSFVVLPSFSQLILQFLRKTGEKVFLALLDCLPVDSLLCNQMWRFPRELYSLNVVKWGGKGSIWGVPAPWVFLLGKVCFKALGFGFFSTPGKLRRDFRISPVFLWFPRVSPSMGSCCSVPANWEGRCSDGDRWWRTIRCFKNRYIFKAR